jgi:hypothetical protein
MIPYFLSFLSYTYPLRPIACAKTMHISMQDASARWLQQVLTQAKPTVMPTSNNNKSFSAVQPTAQFNDAFPTNNQSLSSLPPLVPRPSLPHTSRPAIRHDTRSDRRPRMRQRRTTRNPGHPVTTYLRFVRENEGHAYGHTCNV